MTQPQGWVSGGGRGFAPTPTPGTPSPHGGGSRLPVRCNGFVNYILSILHIVYIFNVPYSACTLHREVPYGLGQAN
jgi:hypothetical protein